jgi:hypothetical protein
MSKLYLNIFPTKTGVISSIYVPMVWFADQMRPETEVREYWRENGKSSVWIDFWMSNRMSDLEAM